jgi:hypothetical protein
MDMVEFALAVLVILWLMGYVQIPWLHIPRITVFSFNGRPITFFDILIAIVVIWLIDLLPTPFREVSILLLLLYVLSLFGIIAIAGFSNIVVIAIVLGILFFLVKKH